MQDLHLLPKLRDSLSYFYVEHAIVERDASAIKILREEGRVQLPAAGLAVMLIGPGTSVTHAAVKLLTESGCTLVWVGEDGTRCYAQGMGETRKGYRLVRQATLVSDPDLRVQVIRRMYTHRFAEDVPADATLQQIRGMEGGRMRNVYAMYARRCGVVWEGRSYDRGNWNNSDPVNRALSAANALLNGICHAAIVSGGYSPGLGFIHTGKQLSFVYDIADLYKTEITIPVAFTEAGQGIEKLESRVRQRCRERFKEVKLLERILPDIDRLLDITDDGPDAPDYDADQALPGPYWDPEEEGDS
ncbi:MAG: type I-E CRISPR-associated endonuclease Cas1e [Anaerolineae bacterium]